MGTGDELKKDYLILLWGIKKVKKMDLY